MPLLTFVFFTMMKTNFKKLILLTFLMSLEEGIFQGRYWNLTDTTVIKESPLPPFESLEPHRLEKRFTISRIAKVNLRMNLEPEQTSCLMSSGHFPLYENCSAYILCKENQPPEKKECPGDLHFNPMTSLCDFPKNAGCKDDCTHKKALYPVGQHCRKYLSCGTDGKKVENCPVGTHYDTLRDRCETVSKTGCPFSCPDHEAMLPLPGKCDLYADCRHGVIEVRRCPENLHFDPLRRVCDYPWIARCNPECPEKEGYFPVWGVCGAYLECVNHKPKINFCPPDMFFNFLTRRCGSPEKSTCNLKCPQPNGFFPVPGICSAFMKCVKRIPTFHRCPPRLEFNPILRQCDLAEKANCRIKCTFPGEKLPIPGMCNYYATCTWSTPKIAKCPDDLSFHPLLRECVTYKKFPCLSLYPEDILFENDNSPAAEDIKEDRIYQLSMSVEQKGHQNHLLCPKPNGSFPMPGMCDAFIRCFNGRARLQPCPKGLHYNERAKTCDLPDRAGCQLQCRNELDLQRVQGDCTAYAECSRGRPSVTFCERQNHFSLTSLECEDPKTAGCVAACPEPYGYFPKPGLCDSFIHCHRGTPTVLNCPPGLHFNPKLLVCDFPQYAGCIY